MKRKLFLMLAFVFAVCTSNAQDIITKVDGEEIQAVITEVGTSDIKYKKFDNQNGPAYTMLKSEIFMIKYQNGEKEMFDNQVQIGKQTQKSNTQAQSLGLPDFLRKTPIENETGRWILFAGINSAHQVLEYKNDRNESDPRSSYTLGLTYEFPLSKTLPIYGETGFVVSDKGGIESYESYESNTTEKKHSLIYLNLPFVVSYRLQFSSNFAIQPFYGLYLGYAVYGFKYDETGVLDAEFFKKGRYERFDMGRRYGVSATYERIVASLGWESGFINIQNKAPKNYSLTNKSFFFTLGYKF